MVAERHGRPIPVWRRLGEMDHRPEMPQPANRRVACYRPALQLGWGELLRHVLECVLWYLAPTDEPPPGLGQRDPHQPATALAGTAGEGHQGAERHQIASHVINRRD